MTKTKVFIPVAILALLSTGYLFGRNQNTKEEQLSSNIESDPQEKYSYAPGYVDLTYASEQSINSVVHVTTKSLERTQTYGYGDMDLFDYFFGERNYRPKNREQVRQASGSGVILDVDGYIVTNNHVINGADTISVTLNDKRTFKAKLVGADPSTDLALLKIDAENLKPAKIGDSESLKIGEWVLAVGNPFNLTSTVTAGIVSAKARNINILTTDLRVESFIQTDAAVNPGNSGGALVNSKGELVGINAAIASQTGSYSGYSFAIPVSIMKKVVADLRKYGVVQRALLGVKIQELTDELAKENGINVLDGAYVAYVTEDGAANEAGIKVGDVITKVNDKKVKSVPEVQEQISKFSPGNKVKIAVLRDGKESEFSVVLKNPEGNTSVMESKNNLDLGVKVKTLSEQEKHKMGITSGVMVSSVNKNVRLGAYLSPGFIIVLANKQYVNSEDDLVSIVKKCLQTKSGKLDDRVLYLSGLQNGVVKHYAISLE